MQVVDAEIPDVKLLRPRRFEDARGFFSETFNRRTLEAQGVRMDAVQDNHSRSVPKGTVRGLHFQSPPFAQAKLIRVTRGAVFDVAVDIRRGSPTFGRHVALVLSEAEWNQLYVPRGFAHGFCTLEPETEVIYKVDAYYAPEHDFGLAWDDPALGVDWPVTAEDAVLSDKDRRHPLLADLPEYFTYRVTDGAGATP